MAKNKLSHKVYCDEKHDINNIIEITGSIRQPTLVEAQNYILENGLSDFIGLKVAAASGGELIPPEEARTLALYTYGYGQGCPICNHMENLKLDHCPVCLKKWSE